MNLLTKVGVSGLLAAGAILSTTGANAAPAPKANGYVTFTNVAASATLQFSAQEAFNGRDAKGTVVYTETANDGTVNYYRVEVECVDVNAETGVATFSGQIVETSVEAWEGNGVQIWVKDTGEKGGEGDQIGGSFFTWTEDNEATEDVDESEVNCLPLGDEPPAWLDVDGNVVIHDGNVGQGKGKGNNGGGDDDDS